MLTREYPDQTITDSFLVVDKFDSKEDAEGNCYDWYNITDHYRMTDKSRFASKQAAENAACTLDAELGKRLDAIEDALCELDKRR